MVVVDTAPLPWCHFGTLPLVDIAADRLGLQWLVQMEGLTVVAEVTLELNHNMEVQEVHTMEVLVPRRNLCDSPNYGCKYYHLVNSTIGFYSPSWTCKL